VTGVRFIEGDGWEGQCGTCEEWWPLDGDFWQPDRGLSRCRACHNEKAKTYSARYRARHPHKVTLSNNRHAERQRIRYATDPVFRASRLAKNRADHAARKLRA